MNAMTAKQGIVCHIDWSAGLDSNRHVVATLNKVPRRQHRQINLSMLGGSSVKAIFII